MLTSLLKLFIKSSISRNQHGTYILLYQYLLNKRSCIKRLTWFSKGVVTLGDQPAWIYSKYNPGAWELG